ncbi:unnamed protein product [Cochlearia groenlandica]
MSSSTKKMIVLQSSDGKPFEIEEAAALQSQLVSNLIEDDCVGDGIPLSNVDSDILSLVIEYCNRHAAVGNGGYSESSSSFTAASSSSTSAAASSSSGDEDLKIWDKEFMKRQDQSTIFDLILASNYMNIPNLLDLGCQTIADEITACKNAAEIRQKFSIVNDFTAEEEADILKDNQWAFE